MYIDNLSEEAILVKSAILSVPAFVNANPSFYYDPTNNKLEVRVTNLSARELNMAKTLLNIILSKREREEGKKLKISVIIRNYDTIAKEETNGDI